MGPVWVHIWFLLGPPLVPLGPCFFLLGPLGPWNHPCPGEFESLRELFLGPSWVLVNFELGPSRKLFHIHAPSDYHILIGVYIFNSHASTHCIIATPPPQKDTKGPNKTGQEPGTKKKGPKPRMPRIPASFFLFNSRELTE